MKELKCCGELPEDRTNVTLLEHSNKIQVRLNKVAILYPKWDIVLIFHIFCYNTIDISLVQGSVV